MTNIELSTALMVACGSSHSYATTTDLSHLTPRMNCADHCENCGAARRTSRRQLDAIRPAAARLKDYGGHETRPI